MKITKGDLEWAATQANVSPDQAQALWQFLEMRFATRPKFDLPHVAYYFGALVIIAGMGLFLPISWREFGGGGLFLVAILYAVGFGAMGAYLWFRTSYRVPGGLLVTVAVCMAPLAIYALEDATGFWLASYPGFDINFDRWIRGSWFLMDIGLAAAGLLALRFIRFPFLMAPIAFSIWQMGMELTPLLFDKRFRYDESLWVSVFIGLGMLVVAYLIDHRTEEDFAFWVYLAGLMAFWGGLSLMGEGKGSGFEKFIYCLINVGLIFLSIFLDRRAFTVFGALGITGYLGNLAYGEFRYSNWFPFMLSLIGVSVIFFGIQYQRNYPRISRWMAGLVPERLRWLRPQERRQS